MKTKRFAWGLVLLGAVAASMGQAASQPLAKFTIGKETTIVDGPLNADGTINYVAVINNRLSKGVDKENNAASWLLQAQINARNRVSLEPVAAVLEIKLGTDDAFDILDNYAAKKAGKPNLSPQESDALDTSSKRTLEGPWVTADEPLVAEWLKSQKSVLDKVEAACEKPRCFLPWVSKESPPVWLDALPPLASFRQFSQMLVERGMLRAGEGDFQGALADLKRSRQLARLTAEGMTDIAVLVGVAEEYQALRAYEGLATHRRLNHDELKTIREEIQALPPLAGIQDALGIEELLDLDNVMQLIRGNTRCLKMHVNPLDTDIKIDMGDIDKADWDTMLRTTRQEYEKNRAIESLPFLEEIKALADIHSEDIANKIPGSFFSNNEGRESGPAAAEKYLKIRDGESRVAYATRIVKWQSGDADIEIRILKLEQRSRAEKDLALLAVALADYHLEHGAYPGALKDLGRPLPSDPFTGKELIYRRVGDGYLLYNVGPNQKDDGGTDDDRPVKAEK